MATAEEPLLVKQHVFSDGYDIMVGRGDDMVALPLLDIVLSTSGEQDRSRRVASELVRSALDQIRHIESLDESLAPADGAPFDKQTVALVRKMYEDWARDVEGLLERIDPMEQQSGRVQSVDQLRHAHDRTRAMLSISLKELEQSHHDAIYGSRIPIKEVRRELRLGVP
jgi:proline dehydrogenase